MLAWFLLGSGAQRFFCLGRGGPIGGIPGWSLLLGGPWWWGPGLRRCLSGLISCPGVGLPGVLGYRVQNA